MGKAPPKLFVSFQQPKRRLTLSLPRWRRGTATAVDEESILLKTLNRGIILLISLFLRRMFIFCRVTENEPKEHVQKPTVSKDFPFAQNARGAGVLGAPMLKLPAHSKCIRRRALLSSTARLGFPTACSEGTVK